MTPELFCNILNFWFDIKTNKLHDLSDFWTWHPYTDLHSKELWNLDGFLCIHLTQKIFYIAVVNSKIIIDKDINAEIWETLPQSYKSSLPLKIFKLTQKHGSFYTEV